MLETLDGMLCGVEFIPCALRSVFQVFVMYQRLLNDLKGLGYLENTVYFIYFLGIYLRNCTISQVRKK